MAIEKLHIANTLPIPSTLTLSLRDSNYWFGINVFNLEGLGSPKATVSGIGGPDLHGVKLSGVKVDARHIVLTLSISPGPKEQTARENIYEHFPVSKEISFRVESDGDDGDVYIMAIVESVEMNVFAKVENAVISLYCPQPYWMNWLEDTRGGTTSLVFTYDGDVETGCDIEITFSDPIASWINIANIGPQNMKIGLGGWITAAGVPGNGFTEDSDQLIINTRRGEKSISYVRAGIPYNYFMALTYSSERDWIQLPLGGNVILLTTSTPAEVSNVDVLEVKYNELFQGV